MSEKVADLVISEIKEIKGLLHLNIEQILLLERAVDRFVTHQFRYQQIDGDFNEVSIENLDDLKKRLGRLERFLRTSYAALVAEEVQKRELTTGK